MDKFRVGQKVRIIRSTNHPQIVGMACTITSPKTIQVNQVTGEKWLGYGVDIEMQPYEPSPTGMATVHPREEYLEPVYDGDLASSWEESAWKPNMVKEKS